MVRKDELLENLDLVFDKLNDGLLLLSLKGKILKVNDALLKLGGYSREEIEGKNAMKMMKIFPPASLKKIVASFVDAAKGVPGDQYQLQARTKDGDLRLVELSNSLIKKGGKPIGIAVTVRDVTDRTDYEKIIEESDAKFNAIASATTDAIVMMDDKGRVTFWNQAAERMFGYKPAEVMGKELHKIVPSQEEHRNRKDNILHFGKTSESSVLGQLTELPVRKKNGETFTIELSVARTKSSGGWQAVGIMRDITLRKKSEQIIKESEEKFRSLFESSQDAIMTLEPPSWKFTSCNTATLKLFNVKTEKEFVNLALWDVSPKVQPNNKLSGNQAKTAIQKAMKGGSYFFEWIHKKLTGEEFLSAVLLTRVQVKGREILQATVRDISKQKFAEKELKEKLEELEKINNLMVGRELRMVELKEEIKRLQKGIAAGEQKKTWVQKFQEAVELEESVIGKYQTSYLDELQKSNLSLFQKRKAVKLLKKLINESIEHEAKFKELIKREYGKTK